jgi:hypothetical protein
MPTLRVTPGTIILPFLPTGPQQSQNLGSRAKAAAHCTLARVAIRPDLYSTVRAEAPQAYAAAVT